MARIYRVLKQWQKN